MSLLHLFYERENFVSFPTTERSKIHAPGIDSHEDVDPDLLAGIYDRIRACEFKPGADHVTQVMKVEQMIVGKKPASHVSVL